MVRYDIREVLFSIYTLGRGKRAKGKKRDGTGKDASN